MSAAKWEDLLVDGRIADALRRLKLETPFDEQKQAIQALLTQKDLLLASKTGSGKSISYIVPALQLVLQQKNGSAFKHQIRAVILEPTKELCLQTHDLINTIASDKFIQIVCGVCVEGQKPDKQSDILVATPKQLIEMKLKLDWLQLLVVDEADLMLAFNYKQTLEQILTLIPQNTQKALVSATLNEQIEQLSLLMLRQTELVTVKEKTEQHTNAQFVYFTF